MKSLTNQEFRDSITDRERALVSFYVYFLTSRSTRMPPLEVLEIGSGWGLFSRAVMEAHAENRLTTIDKIPHSKLDQFLKHTAGFEGRIKTINRPSEQALNELLAETKRFDVIFVDGDHGYAGFKIDLEKSISLLNPKGVILVDDVYHPNNWKISGEGHDYGIMKYLAEWCLKHGYFIEIESFGHGVAIIRPKE